MHGCNEKIIALTDQLSCLHVLTHLDNGRANPIPILTQGENYPLGKGSMLYCRITDLLRREGDTAKGCFGAHSLPSTVDSWNYEEKQGLAHTEFKVAVLFCGKISRQGYSGETQ
jgi:hypothetical protein